MKQRIVISILLLSLLLALSGCSKEPDTRQAPALRYEGSAAYYTEEGAQYSMELCFTQAVQAGSTIELLHSNQPLVSFTASASFSKLTVSVKELELNTPYQVTVDGVTQLHSLSKSVQDPPALGEYPDPELPTIPMEPLQTMPTQPKEEPDDPLSHLTPITSSPGELPSEPFQPGNGGHSTPDIPSLIPPEGRNQSIFVLTQAVTQFTGVQSAS